MIKTNALIRLIIEKHPNTNKSTVSALLDELLPKVHQPDNFPKVEDNYKLLCEKYQLKELLNAKHKRKSENNNSGIIDKIQWYSVTSEQEDELQMDSDYVYRGRLTLEEKSIIDDYTAGLFYDINTYLYKDGDGHIKYDKIINNIDSAISKFSLEYDLIVTYRGTLLKHYSAWKVGDVKTIKAYVSTSIRKEKALKFYCDAEAIGAEPLLLIISVPKGTPCLYVGDNSDYSFPEYELLLARNLQYKVISKNLNKMIIEVIK